MTLEEVADRYKLLDLAVHARDQMMAILRDNDSLEVRAPDGRVLETVIGDGQGNFAIV